MGTRKRGVSRGSTPGRISQLSWGLCRRCRAGEWAGIPHTCFSRNFLDGCEFRLQDHQIRPSSGMGSEREEEDSGAGGTHLEMSWEDSSGQLREVLGKVTLWILQGHVFRSLEFSRFGGASDSNIPQILQ